MGGCQHAHSLGTSVLTRGLVQGQAAESSAPQQLTPYNTESNANFHSWLQKYVKLEVVLFTKKPYKCRHCDNEHDVERGLDVGLVVKAIELQRSYERLILCNGDGDLGDGLRYLRDGLAKQIVIVGTGETISSVTSLHADEVFDVSAADVSPSLYKD